ncbi:oxidoreductase [Trametes elegans]|nr:oxidoreductase [Trametes elegans]
MAPISTCVLGVGLGGLTFHIPFVLALPHLFKLHAVMERNPAGPGGKLQARFGEEAAKGVVIHRTIDAVLADPEIELVVVTTPSETHYELTKKALQAGKHVLVDKPVTAHFSQAQELAELAKSKKLVLYPYQNRRWDSDFLTLKKLLELPPDHPQSLGAVHEFESRFDRFRTDLKGSWKDLPLEANGLTYDLAAHTIDQALVLFGRPSKITAFVENIRGLGDKKVDDCSTVFLHYPGRKAVSGVQPQSLTVILRGHILSVRSQQVRYVVRGTHGTYLKYGVDVQEDQLRALPNPAAITQSAEYGVEPEDIWGTVESLDAEGKVVKSVWPTTERGDYKGLYENLAAVIRDGVEQAVKFEQSAEVIELIELAYQSAREERTLVVPPRP